MIDLHTHTTASDGRCTPAELAARAAKAGVTVLAVTDQYEPRVVRVAGNHLYALTNNTKQNGVAHLHAHDLATGARLGSNVLPRPQHHLTGRSLACDVALTPGRRRRRKPHVLDAGVYCYRFEAEVPRGLRVVLWGPLQAKELGFPDWTYQDGGETGFVYHSMGRALKLGTASTTLIAVRRLGRAFLTVYLAGYPSDASPAQRRLDVQAVVTEAELFLSRLAREPVRLQETRAVALVDRHEPSVVPKEEPSVAASPARPASLYEV